MHSFPSYVFVLRSNKDERADGKVAAVISIQAVLIYLPLVIVLVCLLVIFIKKVRARLAMDMPSDESLISSMELPPLREPTEEYRPIKKLSIPDIKKVPMLSEYTYGT